MSSKNIHFLIDENFFFKYGEWNIPNPSVLTEFKNVNLVLIYKSSPKI
jgi:hypothetical protein